MDKLGSIHENLDHKVYKTLKSMISERKFMPGTKIHQDKLARELGISRTPLISALKKLEQEKLIMAVPRRGFFVRHFSKHEMIHIFELREVLEGLAARRASLVITLDQIEKLTTFFKKVKISDNTKDMKKYAEEDRKFHRFLMEIGGNDLLSSILGTYSLITFSYLSGFREGLVRPPKETIHEHKVLIDAIIKRDPLKAEELARYHLRKSIEKMLKDVEAEGEEKSRKS